nr:conotoxin precursor E [Conus ebraeus]
MMTRVFFAMFFLMALTEGWPRLYDSDCVRGRNMHITCFKDQSCGLIVKRNGRLSCSLNCKCRRNESCLPSEEVDWDHRDMKIVICPKPWF